jgi:uncharacterized damage-inducible protein DinB
MKMISRAHARTMAAYNRWMNERLYETCAGLGDAERKRDRGAFFKSVHGTLNHLLYGDRSWMSRFTGRDLGWKGPADELYADFDGRTRTLPAWLLVTHMFNHQTHHVPWLPGLTSGRGSTSPEH